MHALQGIEPWGRNHAPGLDENKRRIAQDPLEPWLAGAGGKTGTGGNKGRAAFHPAPGWRGQEVVGATLHRGLGFSAGTRTDRGSATPDAGKNGHRQEWNRQTFQRVR